MEKYLKAANSLTSYTFFVYIMGWKFYLRQCWLKISISGLVSSSLL